jgi:hypothetical protein
LQTRLLSGRAPEMCNGCDLPNKRRLYTIEG